MLKYCLDASKVLQFLHQRPRPIVHLDVKPENLLLDFAHTTFFQDTGDRGSPSSAPSGGGGGVHFGGDGVGFVDRRGISALPKLKLCDLGVSKIQGVGVGGGVDSAVVGTLMYTPPEMLLQASAGARACGEGCVRWGGSCFLLAHAFLSRAVEYSHARFS
jgi:serine/threonine protein kinase